MRKVVSVAISSQDIRAIASALVHEKTISAGEYERVQEMAKEILAADRLELRELAGGTWIPNLDSVFPTVCINGD